MRIAVRSVLLIFLGHLAGCSLPNSGATAEAVASKEYGGREFRSICRTETPLGDLVTFEPKVPGSASSVHEVTYLTVWVDSLNAAWEFEAVSNDRIGNEPLSSVRRRATGAAEPAGRRAHCAWGTDSHYSVLFLVSSDDEQPPQLEMLIIDARTLEPASLTLFRAKGFMAASDH